MTAAAVPSWTALADEACQAFVTHGRPDLAHRVRGHAGRFAGGVRLAVLGFAKQGKSHLLNALLNVPVCGVGDGTGTTVPMEIRYAEEASASLVRPAAPGALADRAPVPVDRIAQSVTSAGAAAGARAVVRAEVAVPRRLLASGLVLVDTPPVREPHSPSTSAALDAFASAHAVLLVTDAGLALTAEEVELATYLSTWCPSVAVALTKIDSHSGWREVAERDRGLLRAAGVDAPVLPVSATLRLEAGRRQDAVLNQRSGYPELLSWVGTEAARSADEANARTIAVCVRAATEQLVGMLKGELDTTGNGHGVDQVVAMQRAQRTADELRRHTALWQNLLADEIADITSDVEYDLRERTRKIVQHIDRTFDETDPLTVWDDFSKWLEGCLAEAVETNYAWLVERAEWVANTVAETFPHAVSRLDPELGLAESAGGDDFGGVGNPQVERFRIGQKLFTGLRGSYGGVVMFGLITGFAGLPLINPLSLGAGVLFATKTVKDEGDARLKRRQAIAKAGAQRYVDDVFLRFSKESRDLVRVVHRRLRDHFTALTEELADDAVRAREAAQARAVRREHRAAELRRDIERLADLHRRAGVLSLRAAESRVRGELSA